MEAVKDVVAVETEVPEEIVLLAGDAQVLFDSVCVASVPTSVVVASGSVSIWLLFELGEVTVNEPVPLALPCIFTELIRTP